MTDPKDTPQPAPQEVDGEQLDQVVGGGDSIDALNRLAALKAEQASKAAEALGASRQR